MIIPAFKEIYTKEIDGQTVKTICTLICTENNGELQCGGYKQVLYTVGDNLSFGISKTNIKSKYNKGLGTKLAYAMAMRFLMLKLNNGEKFVEDNIK